MDASGTWRNEYGSIMGLRQEGDGRLYGSYQSTTGSTGTYYVLGWADPRGSRPDRGRSLALSILWRSIGEDPEDPSWHWVSGHGAQILGEGQEARLLSMHDMVASTPYPGQADIGRHIDKLTFVPEPRAALVPIASAKDIIEAASKTGPGSAFDGEWRDSSDPSIHMRARLVDARYGFVEAELAMEGQTHPAWGFIDPYAGSSMLQSISLSALLDPGAGETVSLSGWLDPSSGQARLTLLRTRGTSSGFSYTQTRVEQLNLVRP